MTSFTALGRAFEIRLPRLADVLSLWMPLHLRADPMIGDLLRASETRRFTVGPGGRPVDLALARRIRANDDTAYRAARDQALADATDSGSVFVGCPHCAVWEAQLSPLAIAVALHTKFWPQVDIADDLAVPALAAAVTRHIDPRAAPPAGDLWVIFPDRPGRQRRLDMTGVAARYQARVAESAALFAGPSDTEDWSAESVGWEALLRLATLVGRDETLAEIAGMRLADFLFLDLVYYLSHMAPVPADATPLTCELCGGVFVPVRPAIDWPPRDAEATGG
jgi:hypothetical protein